MATPSKLSGVKALAFDVFGTVVDWRGSIIREGNQWSQTKGLQVDWAKFADRWRAGYGPSMDKVRNGSLPWMNLDQLHRLTLDDLLTEFKVAGLRRRKKPLESRLASADSLAGCGRRANAPKKQVRGFIALEWKHFVARGYGQIRGAAVGH